MQHALRVSTQGVAARPAGAVVRSYAVGCVAGGKLGRARVGLRGSKHEAGQAWPRRGGGTHWAFDAAWADENGKGVVELGWSRWGKRKRISLL